MDVHALGHEAASSGWRKKAADLVAPRAPIAEKNARTLLGLVFLAMSVKYVAKTIKSAA